jgi:phage terminase large subunit-like protein
VGPCRFGGFNAAGEPIAVPHPAPWVLTAAVSKDQTRNTMTLFPGLFSDEAINEFSIDLGKEIIYADRGRRRLEAVTSSPRSLEGPRSTFTLKNETQHWLRNNEGHAMAEVIARNSTKARDGSSRVLAISNAHEPGENSDAEHDFEAWQAIEQGRTKATGFLYDSLEAPPDTNLADEDELRAGLLAARGDSEWLDVDRHVEEIHDPRNSPATSRRFYLNQIVAAEDAWIAPHEYDRLAVEGEKVRKGTEITLGFDGSKSDDHSALRACRLADGFVFTLGVWDPEEHGGEAPRQEIDGAVRAAHDFYRVVAFFSDLHPWESYVDAWAEEFGAGYEAKASAKHPIAWDMRAKVKESTIELERLNDEIVEEAFRHDGDPRARQHFHNARRRPNRFGVSVGKEHRESPRKIDSVPATMLARTARRLVLANPRRRRRRSGRAVFR